MQEIKTPVAALQTIIRAGGTLTIRNSFFTS
jgi:hypothetical protein